MPSLFWSQPENRKRTRFKIVLFSPSEEDDRLSVRVVESSVKHRLPPHTALVRGQREWPRLVVRIEQHEEGLVQEWSPSRVFLVNGVAGQPDAQAADISLGPVVIGHLFAVGAQPVEILDLRTTDAAALKEPASPEHRMFLSERDEAPREGEERLLRLAQLPVDPADFVVLTIGIVVASLRPAHLIAAAEHRDAL